MKRAREPEGEKGPSMERWLLTYADMITLLMIFFILMYVISSVNMTKFRALAMALSTTLRGEPAGIFEEEKSAVPLPFPGGEASQLAKAEEEITKYLKEQNLEEKVSVREEERGLVISFQETVLFPRGSADLTPEARRVIAVVGKTLRNLPNYIRVEGHTDDLPISTPRFPSNWELSAARATTVVRELITTSGIPPARLSATAYAEYRPRLPNTSEANRQRNRRVDILVLRSTFKEVEPLPGRRGSPGEGAP